MDEIVDVILSALENVGVHAVLEHPAGVMPHLRGAAAVVSVREAETTDAGLGDYIGVREDAEKGAVEIYGKKLCFTVEVAVLAPASIGAETCRDAAQVVCEALLSLPNGIRAGRLCIGACEHRERENHFRIPVSAALSAWFYAESGADDPRFLNFKLKGESI